LAFGERARRARTSSNREADASEQEEVVIDKGPLAGRKVYIPHGASDD
jgi:hypothetical protein